MSKCHSLPGIIKIGYADCADVPRDVPYHAVAGMTISTPTPGNITFVSLMGQAVCEVEEQHDNNVQMEKTRLTFVTLEDIPTHRHLAFFVWTADGGKYIIGSQERPYPAVKVNSATGQPDGEPSVRKYEVSYSARKSLALYF